MNSVQKEALKLLCEIDDICKAQNIKYYLAEHTAAMAVAYKGFKGSEYKVDIMLTLPNFLKLKPFLEEKKDRSLESWENNAKMPGFYFRYVNDNTTLLDTNVGSEFIKNGIFVNIIVLRSCDCYTKIMRKRERCLVISSFFAIPHQYVQPKTVKQAKREYLYSKYENIFRSERNARGLYRYFMKHGWTGSSDKCFYRTTDLSVLIGYQKNNPTYLTRANTVWADIKLDVAEVENSTRYASLEGHEFPVLDHCEKYLMKAYKKSYESKCKKTVKGNAKSDDKWKDLITISEYKPGFYGVFADTILPWEELLGELREKGLLSQEIIEQKHDYRRYMYNEVRPNEEFCNEHWRYVKRTIDRFQCWEKFTPKKALLRELYEKEDFTSLEKELKPVIKFLENYEKNGMGFSFDKEIFDITIAVLRHKGRNGFADKVIKLLPKEYEEDVTAFLKRMGVKHHLYE